ncbi:MAG: hypothetical protein FWD73_17900 [Polyangiaceae bacterium]|nr:hypothetical protein [Polyangiaceae bacterium]
MRIVHGRVTAGHVELDEVLPDGIEVAVVVGASNEPFDLDEDQIRELEESLAEADRGEVVPAAPVIARLGWRQ